jgi:carbamoyl-phosphate synthase large subunit
MKSTGEALGIARSWGGPLYKGFRASGMKIRVDERGKGTIAVSLRERDYREALPIVRHTRRRASQSRRRRETHRFLLANGVDAHRINRPSEPSPNIIDALQKGELTLVFNTPTRGRDKARDGFKIRRAAVEHNHRLPHRPRHGDCPAGCLETRS